MSKKKNDPSFRPTPISLLSLAIFFFLITLPAYASPLILTTSNTYPLSTPEGTGFEDKIFAEAFRRIGREVRIIHLPAERAILQADQGMNDGTFLRIAGQEKNYPNLIRVPEKIWTFEWVVFSKKADLPIKDWEGLSPYDVGIVRGCKVSEAHIRQTRSLTRVPDTEALFNLLTHDRADLVVFDRLQGMAHIKSKGLSEVKPHDSVLASRDMFLYLHRRHAQLVAPLAAALRAMKADGIFQRLVDSVVK
jgi:polar amino acid transport system substrate-binding protein